MMSSLKNFLILGVLGFSFVTTPVFARQIPVSSGRSVEQQADTVVEMTDKEMKFTTKIKEKFAAVKSAILHLRDLLRGEDELKLEQSEYIEKYITALQSLPAAKGFKKSHCDQYQVDEKAKALLQSLCSSRN